MRAALLSVRFYAYQPLEVRAAIDNLSNEAGDETSSKLRNLLETIEMNCPCGARPESIATHPHVIGCPVQAALLLTKPNDQADTRHE
jgi:hypothetical protein